MLRRPIALENHECERTLSVRRRHAGTYRVQLLRIGFRPVLSDPVQLIAGETVQVDLRIPSQPVVLPTVTVPADVCVSPKDFAKYPQLETLWQQARDGASVRTELARGADSSMWAERSGSIRRPTSRGGSRSNTWTAKNRAAILAWTLATSLLPDAQFGYAPAVRSIFARRDRTPPSVLRVNSRTYSGFEEIQGR